MSNISELEASLKDLFDSFDPSFAGDTEVELVPGDVREIRTDLTILAAARPSGN
jgi:hypothetical protein